MMNEAETRQQIARIVREELASAMMALVTTNKNEQKLQAQRFSTEGELPTPMRSIQPFGLSSRAPKETPVLILPIDHNPTHLVAVGNFDTDKPEVPTDGETILYNQFGRIIYLSQSKIQIGSKAASENAVLGQVFKTFMTSLLDEIAAHTHVGNLGYATSPPIDAAAFEALKASPIEDEAILASHIFVEKGV